MKFVVIDDLPDSVYGNTKKLKKLRGEICFDVVAERFRKFAPDSIVFMASACLWHSWHNDEVPSRPEWVKQSNLMIQIYAGQAAVIATIYGDKKQKQTISELEFRVLISDIHRMIDPISNRTLSRQEKEKLSKAVKKNSKHPILGAISPSEKDPLNSHLFRARVAYLQWHTRVFELADFARTWAIYEKFRNEIIESEGANKKRTFTADEMDRFEREFLGNTACRFIRASWALFAIVADASRNVANAGILKIKTVNIDETVKERFDLLEGDLHIASTRLATRTSDLEKKISGLDRIAPELRKYSEEINYLSFRPIFSDSTKDLERLQVPSAWAMILAIKRFVLHDFVFFLQDQSRLKSGKHEDTTILNLRGEAYGAYLRGNLEEFPFLVDLDALDLGSAKKPDLLWKGSQYNILIEGKIRLKPNYDPQCFKPISLILAWETLGEAILQTKELLQNNVETAKKLDLVGPRKNILIVVTEEPLPEHSTYFKLAAKRWNLLANTGIESFAIFTSHQLEFVLAHKEADVVGANLVKVWKNLDPADPNAEIIDHSLFQGIKGWAGSRVIRQKEQELMPGLELPRSDN